jgi:RNA polymerase sigma-70 factor (ECF subfamily)
MDSNTFDTLYALYAPAIFRFAYIKTSSKELAEDISADTFCKFFEYSLTHQNIDNPKAMLYRIASNLVIDSYRKKAYRDTKLVQDAEVEHIASNEDIFRNHSIKESFQAVQTVMKELKKDYEDILLLHYIEDLTVKEISEVLDITENSTRVKLHRAEQSLKKQLTKVDHTTLNPLPQ